MDPSSEGVIGCVLFECCGCFFRESTSLFLNNIGVFFTLFFCLFVLLVSFGQPTKFFTLCSSQTKYLLFLILENNRAMSADLALLLKAFVAVVSLPTSKYK